MGIHLPVLRGCLCKDLLQAVAGVDLLSALASGPANQCFALGITIAIYSGLLSWETLCRGTYRRPHSR